MAVLLTALALVACAAEPILPGIPKVVGKLPIAPYERHEECLRLAAGDKLDYRFEAQLPVSFSIRYSDGATIVIPIAREGVLEDGGVFQPRIAHDYCLLWEAGQRGAIVDYRIRLQRAP